ERLNSFNDEMHAQLAECLKQVERDDEREMQAERVEATRFTQRAASTRSACISRSSLSVCRRVPLTATS
ncbi:hypothetical protein ACUODF_59570, partial [Escherichia coli]